MESVQTEIRIPSFEDLEKEAKSWKGMGLSPLDDSFEISAHEFQVTKPNGDIDFIQVNDLPQHVAYNFVKRKYSEYISVVFIKTYTK